MTHKKVQEKMRIITGKLQDKKFLSRALPLITGLIALTWFLVRVIPKPQRASYPCMKAAYPMMSGLVIWLISVTGMTSFFRLSARSIREKKYFPALVFTVLLIISGTIFLLNQQTQVVAATQQQQYKMPVHPSNQPMGTPQGIIPGRVVWSWDPAATNENCTNDMSINDGYFLAKNNDQTVIDRMIAETILGLAGRKDQKESWDAIFRHFNKKKGKGDVGYDKSEKIFIKINLGCAWSVKSNSDLTRRESALGYAETSPQVVLSVLKQLVNVAGVPQEQILIADPMSHIYQDNYELLHAEFPNVKYGDRTHEADHLGRTFIEPDTIPVIFYSDKGTLHKSTPDECLYRDMVNADYMINIAALKAHGCAGISLCSKNHFGSITRNKAIHLHASHVSRGNDRPVRVDYKMYRVFVDLMGSKYLGGNTLLFIVDGLWGGTEAVETPVKWVMEPFNNDWPNSIFISLDQVALESVCFDFLRTEAAIGSPLWKNRPNFAQGVDDYLHQAASSKNWPDGIVYDPDKSGKPIPSLGVHEHWNNAKDKLYSKDMGKKEGIELMKILANK